MSLIGISLTRGEAAAIMAALDEWLESSYDPGPHPDDQADHGELMRDAAYALKVVQDAWSAFVQAGIDGQED
jgi:hypothetical protein